MRNYFLLEILTEELPVSYIYPAVSFLKEKFINFLKENEIEFKEIKEFFTPRRIGFLIYGLPQKRKIRLIEIQGPPKNIAFDEKSNLTDQGKGFLKANRAKEKDIIIKKVGDKEYVFIKKKVGGEDLKKLLSQFLPNLIRDIPFPKRMKISENLTFARPIHSICALFNNQIIKFKVDNIKSSNLTYPHRDKSFKPIRIKSAKNYFDILRKNGVISLYEEREKIFYQNLEKILKNFNAQIIEDKELIFEMLNICEYPSLILCQFEKDYLSLPQEVIITGLKNYLHALAIKKNDELLPYFIVVTNKPFLKDKKAIEEIKNWYERACQARLEDAKYYFNEDLKKPLEELVEEEKKVIWIEDLGTLYDKTERISSLIRILRDEEDLKKIAYLSKVDLLTNMVREKEFTSLQGIMGGIYAKYFNYSEPICAALYEQYQDLPKTVYGAYLTIVDRIDNINASFIKGAIPKGSYDPFGLKKQADNIINTIVTHNLDINLKELITFDLELFSKLNINFDKEKIKKGVFSFFTERLELYIQEKNYPYDIARAVSKIIWFNPKRALKRCEYLRRLKEEKKEDYEKIVIGQKRVRNILKGINFEDLNINENLLIKEEEKELLKYSKEILKNYEEALNNEDYEKSLNYLLSLRLYIDKFFDNVFVMDENLNIRNNRLKIVKLIKDIFDKYCDFSECVI
ncbi:MAG: glycine--tRNA ligase subunit beta [candidate division WOR-3 bacterium]|nr:glycine--tRNA ligase subunit beta [candidate division WOR-3 bacterium]MCX7836451.1 glycine--tRNA ligase subunit beta [candidate division WOR-3 bacterium]MDW8114204.1 glycine--tRNA ligase subunit beta [candidate division WOR-3 bacterium]